MSVLPRDSDYLIIILRHSTARKNHLNKNKIGIIFWYFHFKINGFFLF